MKKRLLTLCCMLTMFMLATTFNVQATETNEIPPEDGYILGVDENGNQINIESSSDITINIEDIETNTNNGESSSGEMNEDFEIEQSGSLQIEEELNAEDLVDDENPLDKVTPIVPELDEEIDYGDDVEEKNSISPIVIIIVIIVLASIISAIVLFVKKKK